MKKRTRVYIDGHNLHYGLLKDVGFDGCLAVEREAGDDRPGVIARAVRDLQKRGF